MAVVAPIPRAMVNTATPVIPGLRFMTRTPTRRSVSQLENSVMDSRMMEPGFGFGRKRVVPLVS
jgi:hypothetical protein